MIANVIHEIHELPAFRKYSTCHQAICCQKIYGLYGLERHIVMVEINGVVTDAGRIDCEQDRATQPLYDGRLNLAM